MKTVLDKEKNEFLELFSKESAMPSNKFRNELKKKMIKEFRPKHLSLLGLPLGLAFSAFVVIIVAVVLFDPLQIQNINVKETQILNDNEKKQILSNIIKSNSNEAIIKITNPKSTDSIVEDNRLKTLETAKTLTQNSDIKNYQYLFSTTTTSAGKQFESCLSADLYSNDILERVESYNLIESNTKVHSKTITYNQDNELIDYSLVSVNGDNVKSIRYKGGEYAAEENFVKEKDTPVSFPTTVSYPVSFAVDDLTVNQFFSNVDLKTTTKDGQTYFIVEKEASSSCGKIITKTLIDSQTYDIKSTDVYRNNTSEGNLIYSTQTNSEKRSGNLTDLLKNFIFEYNVPLSNFDDQDITEVDESIINENIEIAFPALERYSLDNISSEKTRNIRNYKFFIDRLFYPQNESGDDLFEQFLQENNLLKPENIVSLLYRNQIGDKAYIDLFNKAEGNAEILDSIGTLKIKSIETIDLKVDGTEQKVELYTVEDKNCIEDINCRGVSKVILIEGESYKTLIGISSKLIDITKLQINNELLNDLIIE
jgi:hypothetical protein